jgi:hypothetical protein
MLLRALVASSLAVAVGLLAWTAALGVTGSGVAAIFLAAAAAGLMGWQSYARPIAALDEAACPRGLKIVSGLATILASILLARLAVFAVAPSRVCYSAVPSSDWEIRAGSARRSSSLSRPRLWLHTQVGRSAYAAS